MKASEIEESHLIHIIRLRKLRLKNDQIERERREQITAKRSEEMNLLQKFDKMHLKD